MYLATRRRALLFLAVVATGRAHAFQDTTRISNDPNGGEADESSWAPTISRDGRFVAFSSWAENLVAGDGNWTVDVFVFDRATGVMERADLDSSGNEAIRGGESTPAQALSADGSRVVFFSGSDNLVANDGNYAADVFLRDRTLGTTTRVSVDSTGVEGNRGSDWPTISADGNCVAYASVATNLVPNDANGKYDVFVHDLVTGVTERVSVDSSGAEANGDSFATVLSADGRFVAFGSMATNLAPGDTNNRVDVYLRDRLLGTTELISVDPNGVAGCGSWPRLSDDGRFVVFYTSASLVPADTNAVLDIYLRDRTLGLTTLVSIDSNGSIANDSSYEPSITPDGSVVGFTSWATNLVAGDTNGRLDAFLHVMASGVTRRVSVDSSGGEANSDCWLGEFSADSRFTVFESRASDLVANDHNNCMDIFVRERCPTTADWVNYDSGYPGTHGVPAIVAQQFPAFGASVTVSLENSLLLPTVGLLVIGTQRASLPTKFGGTLLVLPTWIVPITFSYGLDSFTGTVPDEFALCGTTIDLQGIEIDPGAAHGLSFSQGLELTIGN